MEDAVKEVVNEIIPQEQEQKQGQEQEQEVIQDDIIGKAVDELFKSPEEKEPEPEPEQKQKQEEPKEQKEEESSDADADADADKSGKAFAAMRAEIKALKQALEEKEKGSSVVEQYQKRIAELEEKLGKYSIVETPQFIETFERPRAEIEAQLTKILKEFEIENAEQATTALLTMPVRKRVEWLKEYLPDIAQTVLNTTIQYDAIMEKRNAVIQNHKQYLEKWQSENKNKKSIEDIKLRQQILQKAVTDLIDQKLFIIQPSENNEAQKKLFDFVKDRINYLFRTNDSYEQAKAMVLGAVAPVYLQMMIAERNKRLEVEGKIGKKASAGKIGKQVAPAPNSNEGKKEAVLTVDEALNKLFSKKA